MIGAVSPADPANIVEMAADLRNAPRLHSGIAQKVAPNEGQKGAKREGAPVTQQAAGMSGFDFSNAMVVVTGAGAGIGQGIAQAFHAAGGRVALGDLRKVNGDGRLPNATVARGSASRQRALEAAARARAPVGAGSSVSSSLSAGVGPRAGAGGARRVRAGAAGLPAPPRRPVRARPISWTPAGAEPRRLSRAATRSDPT